MKWLYIIISVFVMVLFSPSTWAVQSVPTAAPTPGTSATGTTPAFGPPVESTADTPPVSTVTNLYGTTASSRNYVKEAIY